MRLLKKIFYFLKDVYHYVRFPRGYIAYRGVFESFEQAMNAKPSHIGDGTQKQPTIEEKIAQLTRIFSQKLMPRESEYPVFFWLDRIFASTPNASVCDFGGGNGEHYFAYTSCTDIAPKWSVCELENNVTIGRAITQNLGINNLTFDTTMRAASILHSSAALWYVKYPYKFLEDYLTGGGEIAHIILTRMPIQSKVPTFVTLQNALNLVYQPLYIFNKDEFVNFFTSRGFELVDEWGVPTDGIYLPFHRDISVPSFRGFYFRKV